MLAKLSLVLFLSGIAFAEPIQPVPEPLAPGTAQPVPVAPAPILVPAPVCKVATTAEVYTVTTLTQCGQKLPNSYLRGVINRARRCTEESVVAEAFASTKTCETCEAKSEVDKIRCERGQACVCGNPDYLRSLVADLTSASKRVRHAAERSLRLCDFRVTSKRACVEQEVPSYILY